MKKLLTLMYTCLLCLLLFSNANALQLSVLESGGSTIFINDNVAPDASSSTGKITITDYTTANWTIDTTGLNLLTYGTSSSFELDLLALAVSSVGAGTLQIGISEINVDNAFDWIMSAGGTTDGTVSFQLFENSGNSYFGGTSLGVLGAFGNNTNNFDFSGSGVFSSLGIDSSHSVDIIATITHQAAGNTSFDATLHPVHEPATILLLGAGLIGLAGFSRKRFKK